MLKKTGFRDARMEEMAEYDRVDMLGMEGTVRFRHGSFGIAFDTAIDWEKVYALVKDHTGKDALFMNNSEGEDFMTFWELTRNFACSGKYVDVVSVTEKTAEWDQPRY